MSTTVSNYLSNISSQQQQYPLAQTILSKITIAAGTSAAAYTARQELPGLFANLVTSLIASGKVPAATLLCLVGAAAPTGGHVIADTGALGSVTVSGSTISIAAGLPY